MAVIRSLEFRNACEITSTLHVYKYDVEKTLGISSNDTLRISSLVCLQEHFKPVLQYSLM